jgi:hypothetical protein
MPSLIVVSLSFIFGEGETAYSHNQIQNFGMAPSDKGELNTGRFGRTPHGL